MLTESPGYVDLQQALNELTGINLNDYRSTQMRRRLESYLQRNGFADFCELKERISKDEAALSQLKEYLTINVSEFFRNPDRFKVLEDEVIPELGRKFAHLRIWSAGCSIGAEPYSLAVILQEQRPGKADHILATDIDETVLQTARQGIYSDDKLNWVSAMRMQRFFNPTPSHQAWQVKDILRSRVRFELHNLLRDPFPTEQHLILCRNVVIYFTNEAKERIFHGFAQSLVPGGYLLLGGSESIFKAEKFGLELVGPFLYRRMTLEEQVIKRPTDGTQGIAVH